MNSYSYACEPPFFCRHFKDTFRFILKRRKFNRKGWMTKKAAAPLKSLALQVSVTQMNLCKVQLFLHDCFHKREKKKSFSWTSMYVKYLQSKKKWQETKRSHKWMQRRKLTLLLYPVPAWVWGVIIMHQSALWPFNFRLSFKWIYFSPQMSYCEE